MSSQFSLSLLRPLDTGLLDIVGELGDSRLWQGTGTLSPGAPIFAFGEGAYPIPEALVQSFSFLHPHSGTVLMPVTELTQYGAMLPQGDESAQVTVYGSETSFLGLSFCLFPDSKGTVTPLREEVHGPSSRAHREHWATPWHCKAVLT